MAIIITSSFAKEAEDTITNDINKLNRQMRRFHSICDIKKMDIIALITVGCLGSIAASAGAGGGVISIPVFLVFMNIPFCQAIALSTSVILGGSLCSVISDIVKKKPELPEYVNALNYFKSIFDNKLDINLDKLPIMDLPLVIFLSSLLSAGTLLGILISKVSYSILSFLILEFLLIYVFYKTWIKFWKIREIEKISQSENNMEIIPFQEFPQESEEKFKIFLYLSTISKIVKEYNTKHELKQESIIIDSTNRNSSYWSCIGISKKTKFWLVLIILCMLSVWFGSLESGLIITRNSLPYWISWMLNFGILLVIPIISIPRDILISISSIINTQERIYYVINKIKYAFHINSDINESRQFTTLESYLEKSTSQDTKRFLMAYLEIIYIGIIGGITGASGGIQLATIFYSSQVDPASVAANNSACLVISSLVGFSTYTMEKRVPLFLALLVLATSFIFTMIGKSIINYFVKKYKLVSIVVGILLILITLVIIYLNYNIAITIINQVSGM
ncbi:hypothetical protein ACR3K2_00250 [Cryptosporidium serpentis]